MEEAIRDFHTQFGWEPTVMHAEKRPRTDSFILNGMGGSHLAADLLRAYKPELDLSVFSDYGLPPLFDKARIVTSGDLAQSANGRTSRAIRQQADMRVSESELSERLFIASSFSGNTEETIDFAEEARVKKLSVAAIAKGGKLLELAKEHTLPHVVLPPVKIQPRSGLGYQMLALAALLGDAKLQKELAALASVLKPEELEGKGEALAGALRGKVPVVYSSVRNRAVAYNWKIKFNETGKIPAFYNCLPELNHNEMTGFDVIATTEGLSHKFHFIFLTDSADHPQNQKRMQVTRKLYEERGLSVTEVPIENTPPPTGNRRSAPLGRGDTTPALADSGTSPTPLPAADGGTPLVRGDRGNRGDNRLVNIFTSLLVADWTALHLSRLYGTEAEQVPMVEQFKKLIS